MQHLDYSLFSISSAMFQFGLKLVLTFQTRLIFVCILTVQCLWQWSILTVPTSWLHCIFFKSVKNIWICFWMYIRIYIHEKSPINVLVNRIYYCLYVLISIHARRINKHFIWYCITFEFSFQFISLWVYMTNCKHREKCLENYVLSWFFMMSHHGCVTVQHKFRSLTDLLNVKWSLSDSVFFVDI